ncbi:MAG: diphosphomevalonate decarboxylase [Planctomycetes bacterium]|nr:diphosphomevalonate decarboxylase [Planctomycetota bacterium]
MRQVTATAPSNIAFIKYWGARDLSLAIPENASLSMTLDVCRSTTTVTLHPHDGPDEIHIAGDGGVLVAPPESFVTRFRRHVATLREMSGGPRERVEAVTRNTFPSDAGIASSASGFCALALAVSTAFGAEPDATDLSVRARRSGSGSAARSAMGGYVEWPPRDDPEGPAFAFADQDAWELRDVIALVQRGPKGVSSVDGHRRATSSPHFRTRQKLVHARLDIVRSAIRDHDFAALTSVLEEEALELHLIAMSSRPPILYWSAGTLDVLHRVQTLRADGVPCAFTMDAGANVHVICPPASEDQVAAGLQDLSSVVSIIRDRTGGGPSLLEDPLG